MTKLDRLARSLPDARANADLCGEVLFMRAAIDRCHATAAESGARIVHACGVAGSSTSGR